MTVPYIPLETTVLEGIQGQFNSMKENAVELIKLAYHRKFFKSSIKAVPEVVVRKLNKRIQKHREDLKRLMVRKE